MQNAKNRLTFSASFEVLARLQHFPYTNFTAGTIVSASNLLQTKATQESLKDRIEILYKKGKLKEAVSLFTATDSECILGTESDIYDRLLQGCIASKTLAEGRRLHAYIIQTGFFPGIIIRNRMVYMYTKCGSLEDARQLFDKMPQRIVSSWNTLITGYAKWGRLKEARNLFDEMPERDCVSWNAMIAGHAGEGHGQEALKLFERMHFSGMVMNDFTFGSVLSVCASVPDLNLGKQIHALVIKTHFQSSVIVGSALLDVYCKSTCMEHARQVFDKMPERNLISWTAMITGYAHNGYPEEALKVFFQMLGAEVWPNEFTFASVLSSCARLPALEVGKSVHAHVVRNGFGCNIFVGSALLDMYAKCGSIEHARQVFNEMPRRDDVLWNVMISGYAQNGSAEETLQLFEQMVKGGVKPDHITFIGVLSACSHRGLVDKGLFYFNSMRKDYFITPIADHYACIIDLVGRAGRLDLAEDILNKMPIEPDVIVWSALLGACRIHGNMELGTRAAERLLELEPQNGGIHVLLSNIYAAAGRWDEVARVRKLMKERGVKKEPGYSWIEVKGRVNAFIAEDRSHPLTEEIYKTLDKLASQMRNAGYVPNTAFVLHDIEE